MTLKDIERKLAFDVPLSVITGKTIQLGNLEFTWWGLSQWYKWRWYGTHIDLGVVSIYGLKSKWWIILAWLVKPMRYYYHRHFVREL